MPTDFPAPGLRREGRQIVLDEGGELPRRCVRCNQAATITRSRRIRWHKPWVYFLILLGVLTYAVVALFVIKQRKLEVGYCAQHNRRRLMSSVGNALAIVGGTALLVSGGALPVLGTLLILGAALNAVRASSADVRATFMDEQEVRLKGFGEPFLASVSTAATPSQQDWGSSARTAEAAAPLPRTIPLDAGVEQSRNQY